MKTTQIDLIGERDPVWSVSCVPAHRAPEFQQLLSELNGGGKCNWAQPGKMKKLLGMPRP
jgi:hypothetical protein